MIVGRDDRAPSADLARRASARGAPRTARRRTGKGTGQGKDGEHRAKRSSGEGDQKGQTGPASVAGGHRGRWSQAAMIPTTAAWAAGDVP